MISWVNSLHQNIFKKTAASPILCPAEQIPLENCQGLKISAINSQDRLSTYMANGLAFINKQWSLLFAKKECPCQAHHSSAILSAKIEDPQPNVYLADHQKTIIYAGSIWVLVFFLPGHNQQIVTSKANVRVHNNGNLMANIQSKLYRQLNNFIA